MLLHMTLSSKPSFYLKTIAVSQLQSVIGYRLTVEINVKEEELTTVKLDTRFSYTIKIEIRILYNSERE